jgi:hypothetical protein
MTLVEQIFMPSGVIALISWIFWQIKYPAELWWMMRFKDGHVLPGILAWFFLLGAVWTVTKLCFNLLG